MAQWNLSVQLRGQGTGLARTLRQNAAHARALADAANQAQGNVRQLGTASTTAAGNLNRMARQARDAARDMRRLARAIDQVQRQLRSTTGDVRIAATLDDRTAPGIAAVRAALDDLERRSPIRITTRFDAADATAAAAAFRTTENAAQSLGRALLLLRQRALAVAEALDEIRDRALLATGRLHLLAGAARGAGDHMGDLSTRTRTLRGDMDDLDGTLQRIVNRLSGVNNSLTRVNQTGRDSSFGTLAAAAIALGTALIPVAAAAAPIAMTLAAAGAGATALGVAVAGQIASMAEAAEAEKKYDEAVAEHGRHSQEAAEAEAAYLRQVQKMPPATREAAAGFSALKDDYRAWSDSLADDTMPAFTKGFATLRAMLPTLTPIVQGAGDELDRLATIVGGAVASPGFDAFMQRVAGWSTDALATINSQLVDLSRSAGAFSPGSGFNTFMEYARRNGPLVAETLKNLTLAIGNILEGAADMGVTMLGLVNAFARMVNALPPEFIGVVLQLVVAFKAARLAAIGLAAVTGSAAVANLTAFVRAARLNGVGSAIVGVAQRMTALQKAAVGLGVLAVVGMGISHLAEKARGAPPDVDKLTSSLKRLADSGRFTGELRKTFGDVDGLIKKARTLATETEKAQKTAFGFRIPVLDDAADWISSKINDMAKGTESLTAIKEDFTGLDQAMAQLVSSGHADQAAAGFRTFQAALTEAGYSTKEINSLFPEYRDAVANLKYEQQLAAQAMGLFGEQALSTKGKLDAQKASADGLRQAVQALNDVNRAALGGMIGFEAAIDTAAKAAQENAGSLRMVNGQLDLNSPKAQAAATALADLGTKTDEAAAAARESGSSWEQVNGIYERGRSALISNAQAMGLTRGQAKALADQILTIPDKKSTTIEMRREDAIAGLNSVISKIKATPGSKSVTVKALTRDAISLLESVGFKTKRLPDGRIQVSAAAGDALGDLSAVRRARDGLRDKTITITTHYRITGNTARAPRSYGQQLRNADGSITDYYADGGLTRQRGGVRNFAAGAERHIAQIAPAGTWRVWAEPETGGEAYIPLAPSKRNRSREIAEEAIRRLGGQGIAWEARGGVMDFARGGFSYQPSGGMRSITDVQSRYSETHQPITREDYNKKIRARASALDRLREAEAKLRALRRKKHTRAQEATAERRVASARRSYATATEAAATAQARYNKKFSPRDWARGLESAVKANAAWEADLARVGKRAGFDVEQILRGMGIEGAKMVDALSKASSKEFKKIVANLRKLAPSAKAALADYTKQLNATNKTSAAFQANLVKLSAMGYGDLAAQLAAQGDEAAEKVAAGAVSSRSAAAAANKGAKANAKLLSNEELAQLVQIIAAIKSSRTGIHDVAGTTQLGEDAIVSVATRAQSQIKSSLGSRATRFLSDLAKANQGLAYADGGIREGIYATRGGAVTFAEPSTGGEAYIPLGANKRANATRVLSDVAGRFGVGLTDAQAGRVVIVREQGPIVGQQTWNIGTGGDARRLAREIERRDAYQLRRLARGGVGARS